MYIQLPRSVFIISFIDHLINCYPYFHHFFQVILIFGICGAFRCDELSKLKVEDVEDLGNKYLVSINYTKNDMPRQFIIGDLFSGTVKQYIASKPNDSFTDRFFIQYHNGKCQLQIIGRNKIGETPQSIASYLGLGNPKVYWELFPQNWSYTFVELGSKHYHAQTTRRVEISQHSTRLRFYLLKMTILVFFSKYLI